MQNNMHRRRFCDKTYGANVCEMLKENACDKDLETDQDEYRTAEDACFTCKCRSEFSSEKNTGTAYDERYRGDDQNGYNCLCKSMLGDGEADGECVNRGCDALYEKRSESELGASAVLAFAVYTLDQHFASDIAE